MKNLLALGWLALLWAVSACNAEPAPETVAEGASPASQPLSEVESLVIWTNAAHAPVLDALGQEFTAAYGVAVDVQAKEWTSLLADFKLSLSRGTDMPDILLGGHDWVSILAPNGAITPLNLSAHAPEFSTAALQAMAYEGAFYGVPVTAESLALIYNPALVAAPPTAWQDVRAAALEAKARGAAAGLAVNAASPFDFYPVLTGLGGDLFGPDPATGFDLAQIRLDAPESQAALAWLLAMMEDGLIRTDLAWDALYREFAAQRMPFLITGPWSLPQLERMDLELAIVDFPGKGRSFVNVLGYMVNAFAPDPFLAWFFLSTVVVSDEGMSRLLQAQPGPPAYLPLLNRMADARLQAFGQIAAQGAAAPNVPEMEEIWRIWGQYHYAVVQDGRDPAASYEQAAREMAAVLAPRLN